MFDKLDILSVQLTSWEKRRLSRFILHSKAERAEWLAMLESDPQVSGPMLYAHKVVHQLLA